MRWVYNSCVFRYEDFGISAEHKGPDNTYATTDVYICHFFSTTEANVTQSHALCGVLGPAWSFAHTSVKHFDTWRDLSSSFWDFHPVSSTQKAVRMIISGFFPLVFLWGINHVNHPQPLVESITPQWLLVLRCWSTTPLVTSGKLTILYITGLPDVSETRRMLGAWQKPKGMLVSLVQNGPKVTQKFRRFSTGFGHGPTSCARVHMVSRSHGKSWA